jgi:membrane protein
MAIPLGPKRFAMLLFEAGRAWVSDNAMRLSAALSLYMILCLAPLLVITVKVLGIFWRGPQNAGARITQQLTNLLGRQVADSLTPILENSGFHGNGTTATIVGLVVICASATGVFVELQDSMNTIWGVKVKPSKQIREFIRHRLLSLGMVFGVSLLVLLAIFASGILNGFAQEVTPGQRWTQWAINFLIPFFIVALLFGAIFRFLPDVKLGWRNVWLGALIGAILFTGGRHGLALYFKYAAHNSVYGAAGSLAAVLLWVYYSAFSLYYGAEFTKIWTIHYYGQKITPEQHAEKSGNKN